MMTLRDAANDFLSQKRIAVVGVSHDPGEAANFVTRKLREGGYDVFPINPKMTEIEGMPCFPELRSVPGGVDAAVIFTPPEETAAVVRECADLGIMRVWLHRALGVGSYSDDALAVAREHKLTLIPGGCPAMFWEHADVPHRCMRWILNLAKKLPREVETVAR